MGRSVVDVAREIEDKFLRVVPDLDIPLVVGARFEGPDEGVVSYAIEGETVPDVPKVRMTISMVGGGGLTATFEPVAERLSGGEVNEMARKFMARWNREHLVPLRQATREELEEDWQAGITELMRGSSEPLPGESARDWAYRRVKENMGTAEIERLRELLRPGSIETQEADGAEVRNRKVLWSDGTVSDLAIAEPHDWPKPPAMEPTDAQVAAVLEVLQARRHEAPGEELARAVVRAAMGAG